MTLLLRTRKKHNIKIPKIRRHRYNIVENRYMLHLRNDFFLTYVTTSKQSNWRIAHFHPSSQAKAIPWRIDIASTREARGEDLISRHNLLQHNHSHMASYNATNPKRALYNIKSRINRNHDDTLRWGTQILEGVGVFGFKAKWKSSKKQPVKQKLSCKKNDSIFNLGVLSIVH